MESALFKKLNFKDQQAVLCINAPDNLEPELAQLSTQVPVFRSADDLIKIDFALVFVTSEEAVASSIDAIFNQLDTDAVLWYCYPKGTSKRYESTINRDKGWDALGKRELEPVRQVAIDEDWSALRFRKTAFIKTMKRRFAISDSGKKKSGMD